MLNLESITDHAVADTTSAASNRAANVGGISLEDYSIAIDSGKAETGRALRKQLESLFSVPIKYFFLTHTHTDHRNGLGAFKDVTLVTSQKAIKNMPKSVKLTNIRVEAFDKSFIIKNRDLNVEFHHMGGHTIGSSVAYFPHEKILFGGDLFFSGGANFNIPFLSFYQNAGRKTGNPDEYIAAFEKFSDMDLEAIVPGHGTVVFNPEDELNTLLAFFKSLRSFFMTAIDEKKELKSIELPKLELIDCAFTRIEGLPTNKQRNAKRWLDNYLKHLKTSFYNHYSSKSNLQPHKSDQNANYE